MRVLVCLIALVLLERVLGHSLFSAAIRHPLAALMVFLVLIVCVYLDGQYGNKESKVSGGPKDPAKPVIDEGVNDQVHPIRVPTIRDRMRIRKP